jgi:hypothetical protein
MFMRKSKRIGVLGEFIPTALKREVLLFDQLAVLELERVIKAARWLGRDNDYFLGIANDLEFLAERGIAFDAGNPIESATKAMDVIGEAGKRLS